MRTAFDAYHKGFFGEDISEEQEEVKAVDPYEALNNQFLNKKIEDSSVLKEIGSTPEGGTIYGYTKPQQQSMEIRDLFPESTTAGTVNVQAVGMKQPERGKTGFKDIGQAIASDVKGTSLKGIGKSFVVTERDGSDDDEIDTRAVFD